MTIKDDGYSGAQLELRDAMKGFTASLTAGIDCIFNLRLFSARSNIAPGRSLPVEGHSATTITINSSLLNFSGSSVIVRNAYSGLTLRGQVGWKTNCPVWRRRYLAPDSAQLSVVEKLSNPLLPRISGEWIPVAPDAIR